MPILRYYRSPSRHPHHPTATAISALYLARTNPPKTALSLEKHYHSWLPWVKVNFCCWALLSQQLRDCHIEPCHSYNHCKRTIIPSPRTTTLASLVKGRWIDGKAQTVALLISACDMPVPFILQTFLPSRRKDCTPSAPSMRFSALSHSLFVLQSSVCLYGFAFALSHSLFILQSSVCLYGFAFALSHSLFVGAGSLPRPLHRSYWFSLRF